MKEPIHRRVSDAIAIPSQLVRIKLYEDMLGGFANAYLMVWDASQQDYVVTTTSVTAYDALEKFNNAKTDDKFYAQWFSDVKRWELIAPNNGIRLWRFTLNENMGASTQHQAAADLLEMDGTDTLDDIDVKDPLDIFSALLNSAAGLCIEQDGDYYIIQAECP